MERIFNPRQFGALGDGITLDTKAIQAAIDEAGIAAERGAKTIVVLSKGIYLTSSLFLKSHMEFRMEEGAILLGTTDESLCKCFLCSLGFCSYPPCLGILTLDALFL